MTHNVAQLLDNVQRAMERASVWQTQPPAPEKLMSTAPFSVDTLSFLEWLQWIYVARLRALLDANAALPQGAQVLPYAEEALRVSGDNIPGLLTLIEQLDEALS